MAHRGRKRKSGSRTKGGRLVNSGPDRGTPEMQAMRAFVTRDQRLSPDYPLSVLLGHELITQVEHDAGMKFAQDYWTLFGKPFGQSQDYQIGKIDGRENVTGGAVGELYARQAYDAALEVLSELKAVSVITDLAVYLKRGWLVSDLIEGKTRYRRHAERLKLIREALKRLSELPAPSIGSDVRQRAAREMAA